MERCAPDPDARTRGAGFVMMPRMISACARRSAVLLPLIALTLLSAPVSRAADRPPPQETPPRGMTELPSPALPGSGEPDLAVAPDGAVYMSWIEKRDGGGGRLRIARLAGQLWTDSVTVAEGESLFVNWADFPRLLAPAKGRLVAAWMWKRPGGTYAYDVRLASSKDRGRTWSAPETPHRDGTATEHGFVSLAPERDGVRIVWLDGRAGVGKKEGEAEMTLRSAWLSPTGTLGDEELLDPRVCDCCQTAAARSASAGTIVAFRDRDPDEIRDIGLLRNAGSWQRSAPPADRWKIGGCPVNGPALAARNHMVALSWFTAPGDTAQVRLAVSRDGGWSLAQALRVDDGDPIGRTAVAVLPDGGIAVAWLEHERNQQATVRIRRVALHETMRASVVAARTTESRSSGVPRLAVDGTRLLVAWTDNAKPARVRVTAIPIASL